MYRPRRPIAFARNVVAPDANARNVDPPDANARNVDPADANGNDREGGGLRRSARLERQRVLRNLRAFAPDGPIDNAVLQRNHAMQALRGGRGGGVYGGRDRRPPIRPGPALRPRDQRPPPPPPPPLGVQGLLPLPPRPTPPVLRGRGRARGRGAPTLAAIRRFDRDARDGVIFIPSDSDSDDDTIHLVDNAGNLPDADGRRRRRPANQQLRPPPRNAVAQHGWSDDEDDWPLHRYPVNDSDSDYDMENGNAAGAAPAPAPNNRRLFNPQLFSRKRARESGSGSGCRVPPAKKAWVRPMGDPSAPGIADLPPNLLVKIFKNLPVMDRIRSELVCMKWRNVLFKHSWSDFKKLSCTTVMPHPRRHQMDNFRNPEVAQLVERCGRFLTEVDLSDFRGSGGTGCVTSGCIRSLTQECLRVERLSLNRISLNGTVLGRIGKNLTNLTEVYFSGCFRKSVSEGALSQFFKSLHNLRIADLSENYGFTGTFLDSMPLSVQVVKLCGCRALTGDGVRKLRERCPNLVELDISRIDQAQITASLLTTALSDWSGLQILRFTVTSPSEAFWPRAPPMDEEPANTPQFKLTGMPALRECHLGSNSFVSDATVSSLCSAAPQLIELDLGRVPKLLTTHSLSCLSRLRRLERLNVTSLDHFNDTHLISIAANKTLKDCVMHGCREITNEGIQGLLKNCKDLNSLNVFACSSLTNAIVDSITTFADLRISEEKNAPQLDLVYGGGGLTDHDVAPLKVHPCMKVRLPSRDDVGTGNFFDPHDFLDFENLMANFIPGEFVLFEQFAAHDPFVVAIDRNNLLAAVRGNLAMRR